MSYPDDPVLVEVRRGGLGTDVLESVHRGALVVLGADGQPLLEVGDVSRPVLPRSSNKPVQATALLAAGWRPRNDGHLELVGSMLAGCGLIPDDLRCPPALPLHEATRAQWLVAGRAAERLAMN